MGAAPFDGYLIGASGGPATGLAPINQCAPIPPLGDERYVIRNLGVPVIRALTQSDLALSISSRRADSNRRVDRYRHYELPGVPHATREELLYAARPADIQKAGRISPSLDCAHGPRSAFPSNVYFDALMRNLDRWVRRRVAPPPGRQIQANASQAVVDRFGNAVGGVRSTLVDVPTSTWLSNTTGPGYCFIAGLQQPFTRARSWPLPKPSRLPSSRDPQRALPQPSAVPDR